MNNLPKQTPKITIRKYTKDGVKYRYPKTLRKASLFLLGEAIKNKDIPFQVFVDYGKGFTNTSLKSTDFSYLRGITRDFMDRYLWI